MCVCIYVCQPIEMYLYKVTNFFANTWGLHTSIAGVSKERNSWMVSGDGNPGIANVANK